MAWSTLASRLNTLPLLLAGPILRQVTKDSVTVWVALQAAVNVTLTIYEGLLPFRRPLGSSTRETTAVGKLLHIVAVTVRTTEQLKENKLYFYDLNFSSISPSRNQKLIEAMTKPGGTDVKDPARIAYHDLPSFVLPPADLNRLRLIQGSCRKPNGGTKDELTDLEKPDALGLLDQLIEDTKDDPLGRPHQLLLTGDQIYADEVADVLLAMLIDAGKTLLGWSELLPSCASSTRPPFGGHESATLAPTKRTPAIMSAGLTSQDTRSHLMALSEFLAMYLFAWSEELWTDLPKLSDLKIMFPDIVVDSKLATDIQTQRDAVEEYRSTLTKVRRALANIPSYMICDDHEITDDWNMSRRFCDQVYGNDLGLRIVQNGLIAFSICQAWGNVPEQFLKDTQAAGTMLLGSIAALSTVEAAGTHVYNAFDAELRQRVGLHSYTQMQAQTPQGAYHEVDPYINVEGVRVSSTSVVYHFSVEGPSHQVIVTDTRSWRSFPTTGIDDHPDLLGPAALERQIELDPPPLDNRLLLIVTTTNIPPIPSIREVAWGAAKADYYTDKASVVSDLAGYANLTVKDFLYDNDINDSWEFPALAYDRLIVPITDKLPKVGDTLTGQVVFLSGDVHFSFASRLAYWAEVQRYGDTTTKHKVKAVFAQLVASALKNEKDDTRGLQKAGYDYTPKNWQKRITWSSEPAGYLGWNTKSGSRRVGTPIEQFYTTEQQPTLDFPFREKNVKVLIARPDYLYRLDYLATSRTGQTAPSPPTMTPMNDPVDVVHSFATAARAHLDLINSVAKLPQIVGVNNISEITFVWLREDGTPATSVNDPLATKRRVRHTLRWSQPPEKKPYWASYDISLAIDDPAYKQLRAAKEPQL